MAPKDSNYTRHVNYDYFMAWSPLEQRLEALIYLLTVANWQRGGKSSNKPKPPKDKWGEKLKRKLDRLRNRGNRNPEAGQSGTFAFGEGLPIEKVAQMLNITSPGIDDKEEDDGIRN